METTLLCSNPTLFPHVIRHVNITTMQRHLNSSCKTYSYSSSSQAMVIFKNNIINKKRCVVKCAAGGVRDIKESEFSEAVLKSELPVLVEFVANWCGPCRLISPAVQSLALEYKEKLTIVKIDHDLNPSLIEEFKVYGLPTLILFKDGKMVPGSRREGAITKVKLKAYVDSLLDSVSVS